MSDTKRVIRSFDKAFRASATKLVLEEGVSIPQAANDLGISANTLHGWINKFSTGQWSLSDTAAPKAQAVATLSPDKLKIQELERQLRRLTMERDILKKAMAYCVELPK
jgi:transposase